MWQLYLKKEWRHCPFSLSQVRSKRETTTETFWTRRATPVFNVTIWAYSWVAIMLKRAIHSLITVSFPASNHTNQTNCGLDRNNEKSRCQRWNLEPFLLCFHLPGSLDLFILWQHVQWLNSQMSHSTKTSFHDGKSLTLTTEGLKKP